MKQSPILGTAMILVAALLGVVIALGLLQWETNDRAAQVALFPTSTPLPPSPSATPLGSPVGASSATPAPSAAGSSEMGDAAAGAKVFSAKCNACHPNAAAGAGPALSGAAFSSKFPEDGPLKEVTRRGRGAMPAFPASSLSDADLANLVAYLRSLK